MSDDGGIGRLQRRLAAIPKAVKEAVEPALRKSGEEMVATMRAIVPKDTRDLEYSIKYTMPGKQTPAYSQPGGSMTVPENAVAVTVGNSDVRYGHLVEYGSVKAQAQPFFWPAVRLNRKKFTSRLQPAVAATVRKKGGGK